jgi:hypothetical protein
MGEIVSVNTHDLFFIDCIDRQTAPKVICAFIDNGYGQQPAGFNWIES